jgi:uncharacterized protein
MTLLVVASAAIGVLLGLLGGGGGILTLPLLLTVGHLGTRAAIITSLFIVGTSSIAALLPHAVRGFVNWRVGLLFGAAGVLGAQLGARAGRLVPEDILLGGFAVMMVLTAIKLFRCRTCDGDPMELASARVAHPARLLLQAFGVGTITGMVGVGGGFLIVPALTLLARVPTRIAVGTSLLVVALNALSGFTAHAAHGLPDRATAVSLVFACSLGSLVGSFASDHIPQRLLRRGFAMLILVIVGVGVIRHLVTTPA